MKLTADPSTLRTLMCERQIDVTVLADAAGVNHKTVRRGATRGGRLAKRDVELEHPRDPARCAPGRVPWADATARHGTQTESSTAPSASGPRASRGQDLWRPELQAFDRGELEWQMMRRGLDPIRLAALAGVSPRTIYRALAGHRTQRSNAFAILTALARVPVAIAV